MTVFLDYQNVYRRARATFHDHENDPHWMGQVDPVRLAEHLAADSTYDRVLHEVRIYRGIPSQKRDPKGYAAGRRQVSGWATDPRVKVSTRTLQYLVDPDDPDRVVSVREKGIDVALAIDFATLALEKAYDVGILFSLDTDLNPSLEYVAAKQRAWGKPRTEVAAWTNPALTNRRLAISGHQIYCHWVDASAYTKVQDLRDYNAK